jgi:hypothetical protein
MIKLDGATVLLQWATGGLFFLWVTTRHRLVGIGYGWLLRWTYAIFAVGAVVASQYTERVILRDVASVAVAISALAVFVVSYVRRKAGVRQQREAMDRKKTRVAAMTSTGNVVTADIPTDGGPASASMQMRDQFGRASAETERAVADGPEFAPHLDLIAPAIGLIGLIAGGWAAAPGGGSAAVLAIARTVVGALFLGAVSDAMLLGHWYLVQPGLPRQPIGELNDWLLKLWPVEVALLLIPTGMFSVISGSVSDSYGGMLGWFWIGCALMTGGLAFVTRIVLRERFYSAVMAATGMLYLAILTAFGTDLVARAVLS